MEARVKRSGSRDMICEERLVCLASLVEICMAGICAYIEHVKNVRRSNRGGKLVYRLKCKESV